MDLMRTYTLPYKSIILMLTFFALVFKQGILNKVIF